MASNNNPPPPFKKTVIRNFQPLPPAKFVVRKMVIAPPSNEPASVIDPNVRSLCSKIANGLNIGEDHKPPESDHVGPKPSVNAAVSPVFHSIFYSNRRNELRMS